MAILAQLWWCFIQLKKKFSQSISSDQANEGNLTLLIIDSKISCDYFPLRARETSGLGALLGNLPQRNKSPFIPNTHADSYVATICQSSYHFPKYNVVGNQKKSEMHWLTSDWPWTLNGQKLFVMYILSTYLLDPNFGPFQKRQKWKTKRSFTLALYLTAAVGTTLAIFCRLVSKTHCCRLNRNLGFSLTQPHYACINFKSCSTP